MTESLSERARQILAATVVDYIRTAQPVASIRLKDICRFPFSSATIRNAMAELEKEGYLSHPHTSAGKVPTDKGYRAYVDQLMVVERLSEHLMAQIQQSLEEISGGVDKLLRILSHLISSLSGGVGIIVTPLPLNARLTAFKLVPVSYRRMLIVLELDIGHVRTVIVELEQELSDDQLATVEEILNRRLVGLTLQEIQSTMVPRLRGTLVDDLGITAVILGHSTELFEDQNLPEVYTHGLPQTLKSPEFDDQSNVFSLVSLVEDESRLRSLFGDQVYTSEVKVTIGTEHQDKQLEIFASISSGYYWGHTVGSMAVLAPKRILYPHVIALMEFLSNTVSEMVTIQN